MSDARLQIRLHLPFRCTPRPGQADPAPLLLGAHLQLNAINQMEASHSPAERGDPGRDRLEAKLDLMLHWLGQSLFEREGMPGEVTLSLDDEGVEWEGVGFQPGQDVLVDLHLSALLAAPLRLPAHMAVTADGRQRAVFTGMDEELRDLWSQWLFRQHRRAIHAAREGA